MVERGEEIKSTSYSSDILSSTEKYSNAFNLLESTFEEAANAHLTSYTKTLRKRARIEEEDEFVMLNRPGTALNKKNKMDVF
eukprot:7726496-Ditylum_brightwellii.AAC.2